MFRYSCCGDHLIVLHNENFIHGSKPFMFSQIPRKRAAADERRRVDLSQYVLSSTEVVDKRYVSIIIAENR